MFFFFLNYPLLFLHLSIIIVTLTFPVSYSHYLFFYLSIYLHFLFYFHLPFLLRVFLINLLSDIKKKVILLSYSCYLFHLFISFLFSFSLLDKGILSKYISFVFLFQITSSLQLLSYIYISNIQHSTYTVYCTFFSVFFSIY